MSWKAMSEWAYRQSATIVQVAVALAVICGAIGCSSSGTGAPPSTPQDVPPRVDVGTDTGALADSGYSSAEDAGSQPTEDVSSRADVLGSSDPSLTTTEQLSEFYALHGGEAAFPAHAVDAIEALLRAQDDIEAGRLTEARARIDGIFAQVPLSDAEWRAGVGTDGTNIGDPVAYYGLRMLDLVLELSPVETVGTLRMAAVVAPCAEVTRPTLPDLTPETVNLDIHPRILANDGEILHLATALFRRWVHAITGGFEVELVVHVLDDCTTVGFTDDGDIIVSYPDASEMVDRVPADIADTIDFWWVVAPSGVPGDGSGYGRHFITGGMGSYGAGRPLFLSDDAWFTRKPEHLGSGDYTDAEVRIYQPQWFQHEFMHHIYRTWPELGLEDEGHQWFDRSTWPEDFVGVYEPDYYSESMTRRLLNDSLSPSLADGLKAPQSVPVEGLSAAMLVGSYSRMPVLNDWHLVTVSGSDDALIWNNAAGVSWSLELTANGLWSGPDCPYGAQSMDVEAEAGAVTALWFGGERYVRTP